MDSRNALLNQLHRAWLAAEWIHRKDVILVFCYCANCAKQGGGGHPRGRMPRTAAVARKTKETDISCEINIDGTGKNDVDTGIGFLDHMFCAMSKVRRCERRALQAVVSGR